MIETSPTRRTSISDLGILVILASESASSSVVSVSERTTPVSTLPCAGGDDHGLIAGRDPRVTAPVPSGSPRPGRTSRPGRSGRGRWPSRLAPPRRGIGRSRLPWRRRRSPLPSGDRPRAQARICAALRAMPRRGPSCLARGATRAIWSPKHHGPIPCRQTTRMRFVPFASSTRTRSVSAA